MAVNNPGNLALLIDADNESYKIIVGLMAEIANYGTASVRRIYGDWTSSYLDGWKECLLDHSILPIQQFAYTSGKKTTDGAMIIDAMDLLYTSRFSSFCIVSSDSDFTRLAVRIREQGVTVYGFGARKTHKAFIAACNKFVYLDTLNMPVGEPEEPFVTPGTHSTATTPETTPATTPAITPATILATTLETIVRPPVLSTVGRQTRPIDQAALEGLATAINNSISYDDNYANLADVGIYLSRFSPDFNARNYGYDRLREFAEASGIVELKFKYLEGKPPVALVRLKGIPRSPTV